MLRLFGAVVAGAVLLAAPAVIAAAGDDQAQKLLFESRQLDQIAKGSEVTYRFERKVSDEALLGPKYDDSIRLGVTNVNDKGEREVLLRIFTGAQARDPNSWPDLTINPLLIWYLDRSVNTFNKLAGGAAPYLKDRIKNAVREGANVEAVKVDYDGKQVDAFRVKIAPFAKDPSASRMQGYEGARFEITVSDQVPGYFYALDSFFESTSATAPTLEERIKLVGIGEMK